MDIDGFTDALHELNKNTIKTHMRNINRLDDLIDINDEPSVNIKIFYKEEKHIPTLMSLYTTILNYLNFIDIGDMAEYSNEYTEIKNKYDDAKKKDTRKLLFESAYDANDLLNRLAKFIKIKTILLMS